MPKSAAEATPPTGNRFVEFDEFIDYQLNKASKSIQTTDVMVGVVGAALGLTVYLFLFILADHWLVTGGLSQWARVAWWGCGLAAIGYWIVTRLVRPLNGRVNVLFAARQIEKTQPALKSSLLTLTDLKQAGRPTTVHIRGSLQKRAAIGLSKADVEEAVDRSTLMLCSYALLFLLASFCGYALFSPKSIVQSAWRAFMPFTSTSVATRTRIDHIHPGNVEVPALSHLDVDVEISGHAPEEAMLYYTTADGAFVDEPLPLRDTGEGLRRYRGTLIGPDGRGLRQNLTYYVIAGDARSESYSVTVVQSPSAVVDSVDYEYQAYTGLAKKSEPGGAIDAWEGTRVTLHATANQRVKSAMVHFSDTEDTSVKAEELPMLIEDGTKLKLSWQLAFRSREPLFPKFYRVQLTTEDGHQDPQPTLYPLNIRQDLAPKVEVLFPKSDIEAPVNGVVGIAYRASDPDFKLRSLILNLEHDGQVLVTSPRLFIGPPDEESREGVHRLNLQGLNLAAGSRLTYWLEARDNFEPFGERSGNRSVTPRLNIDLVAPKPPTETKQQEETAAKEANEALEQARQEAGQPAPANPQDEQRPENPQDGSESKPSDNPEQGQKPGAEQAQPGTDQQGGDTKGASESTKPGESTQPMPSDRNQDPSQSQRPGSSPQQSTGEQTGDNTQDATQPGEPGKNNDATQPGKEQTGNQQQPGQSGRQDGAQGTEQPSQGNQEQQSGPREKAQEDTAIQKLLDWHKKEQERQRKADEQNRTPGDPDSREQKGTPGETKNDNQTPQREPGSDDPASPMKEQEQDAPGKTGDDQTGPKNGKMTEDASAESGKTNQPGETGNKSSTDPMQQSTGGGDRSKPEDQKGPSSEKPGTNDSQPASPDKNSQPGTSDGSKTNKPGESTGEPSKSTDPGQTGAKPEGAPKPGDAGQEGAPQKPDKNMQSPTGDVPMGKQPPTGEKAAGDRSQSQDRQDSKPGDADASSKGQESPTGQSGDRSQPGGQKSPMSEKPGNSSQKPAGQSNDQGTREQGSGDPGSSTPDSSGGQKTPGQGEAGKQGEKSSTGEKSGTGKSDDGKKTSESGSKPGDSNASSEPGKEGDPNSKDGGKGQEQSGKPGDQPGKEGDSPQDGADGKKTGDKGQGGSQKSMGEEKNSDAQRGSEKGGDQNKSSADQKGGGQQQGGDQKSQDGGGQGKSSSDSSGGQSSQGEPGEGKPGSQAGNKSGMGSRGGSSSGAPAPDGSQGESSKGSSESEPANLENRKKATNLALKRLQETLERGEIDPELQKDLGYTDEELRSFMDRLQERLADNGEDNSPEAQARRRQFEQLLKGIDLETQTGNRAARSGEGQAASGFGSTSRPAPAEYRAAERRYRESLNRKK